MLEYFHFLEVLEEPQILMVLDKLKELLVLKEHQIDYLKEADHHALVVLEDQNVLEAPKDPQILQEHQIDYFREADHLHLEVLEHL